MCCNGPAKAWLLSTSPSSLSLNDQVGDVSNGVCPETAHTSIPLAPKQSLSHPAAAPAVLLGGRARHTFLLEVLWSFPACSGQASRTRKPCPPPTVSLDASGGRRRTSVPVDSPRRRLRPALVLDWLPPPVFPSSSLRRKVRRSLQQTATLQHLPSTAYSPNPTGPDNPRTATRGKAASSLWDRVFKACEDRSLFALTDRIRAHLPTVIDLDNPHISPPSPLRQTKDPRLIKLERNSPSQHFLPSKRNPPRTSLY